MRSAQKELVDCASIGRRTSTSLPDRSWDDVGMGMHFTKDAMKSAETQRAASKRFITLPADQAAPRGSTLVGTSTMYCLDAENVLKKLPVKIYMMQ